MVGKRWAKRSRPVASSQRWSTPCSAMRAAMARLTTSRGASSSTKRSPSRVAQQRAVAAQRLGQQRPGHGRVVQRGRVELHELDVGRRHAGPQRHGHAVAGGLGRVGGHREQLAGPAGGQHDVVGPHRHGPAGAPCRRGQGGHARRSGRPRPGGRGRTSPRARRWPSGRWRRPGPARPRPRWRRRRRARPGAASGRPRGPGRASPLLSRSNSAPRAISSCTRPGPSSTRTRTASSSHRPAPAARVSARCRSVESSSPPSTAATPPWAQRVADWDSAPLVSTPSDEPALARPGQPDGGRQPGHAAAQDQDVEGSRPGLGVLTPVRSGVPTARRRGGPRPRR